MGSFLMDGIKSLSSDPRPSGSACAGLYSATGPQGDAVPKTGTPKFGAGQGAGKAAHASLQPEQCSAAIETGLL